MHRFTIEIPTVVAVTCGEKHCDDEITDIECFFCFFDEDLGENVCNIWKQPLKLTYDRIRLKRCQQCLDHEKSLAQGKEEEK